MAEYRFKVEPDSFAKYGVRVALQRKVLGVWWLVEGQLLDSCSWAAAEEGVQEIKESLYRKHIAPPKPHPGEHLFGIYPVEKETAK